METISHNALYGKKQKTLSNYVALKEIHTELFLKHPYLDMSACNYLIDFGVKMICIDTLNLDRTFNAKTFPVHVKLAEHNIIVAENLINFDLIDFEDPIISVFPLNIIGGDGSPIRAVAIDMD